MARAPSQLSLPHCWTVSQVEDAVWQILSEASGTATCGVSDGVVQRWTEFGESCDIRVGAGLVALVR